MNASKKYEPIPNRVKFQDEISSGYSETSDLSAFFFFSTVQSTEILLHTTKFTHSVERLIEKSLKLLSPSAIIDLPN